MLVLDGHGSVFNSEKIVNEAVNLTAKYLPAIVYEYLSTNGISISNADKAIIHAHHELQRFFEQIPELGAIGVCTGGALIFNNTCVAFNLGDIVVLHMSADGETHRELSKAHNTLDSDEKTRLEGLEPENRPAIMRGDGGCLYFDNQKQMKVIMVSGSLGDNDIRFLTRTPRTNVFELQQGEQLIITSDGVIDGKLLKIDRVIGIVKEFKNSPEIDIADMILVKTKEFLIEQKRFQFDDSSALYYSH